MTPRQPTPAAGPNFDDPAVLQAMLWWFIPLVVLGFLILGITGYQAWKRGYNPIVWTLAGMLSQNPLFVLVVLAMVPYRRRVRLRAVYEKELDTKLAAVAGPRPVAAAAGGVVRDRSIGDQVTELPQRSIGDDQTRM